MKQPEKETTMIVTKVTRYLYDQNGEAKTLQEVEIVRQNKIGQWIDTQAWSLAPIDKIILHGALCGAASKELLPLLTLEVDDCTK
jgi:hypothetical protein